MMPLGVGNVWGYMIATHLGRWEVTTHTQEEDTDMIPGGYSLLGEFTCRTQLFNYRDTWCMVSKSCSSFTGFQYNVINRMNWSSSSRKYYIINQYISNKSDCLTYGWNVYYTLQHINETCFYNSIFHQYAQSIDSWFNKMNPVKVNWNEKSNDYNIIAND